jgi:uncharacterized membrane protein YeaQ/YmgE (transglycosylase-associated protein family)
MAVLFWVVLGILAGAIAKLVAWEETAGWPIVVLLGSVGAVGGGTVAGVLVRNSDTPGFDPLNILLALVGAGLLLLLYGGVIARRRTATTAFSHRDRRAA